MNLETSSNTPPLEETIALSHLNFQDMGTTQMDTITALAMANAGLIEPRASQEQVYQLAHCGICPGLFRIAVGGPVIVEEPCQG